MCTATVINTCSALQLHYWFISPLKIGNSLYCNLLRTGDKLEGLYCIYILNFILKIKVFWWHFHIFKASENTLRGPLADGTEASDEVDGEHEAVVIDLERLEPRSDEDDTYVQMTSLHFCFLWLLKVIFSKRHSPEKKNFSQRLNPSLSCIPILKFISTWYLTGFLCYIYSYWWCWD